MANNIFLWFRDQFVVILIASLFVMVFVVYKNGDFDPETQETMRDLLIAFSGAILTAVGYRRPATNQNFEVETIRAKTIEKADTQTGDIIGGQIGETKKHEDDI